MPTPLMRFMASWTAALTASADGVLPVASWPASDGDVGDGGLDLRASGQLGGLDLGGGGRPLLGDAGVDLGEPGGALGLERRPGRFDLLLRLGTGGGDLGVVVGDVGACRRGDALGLLEVTLDRVVPSVHPVAHLAEQEQAHRQREHDEGAEAPHDFFDFGEDRVEVALGNGVLFLGSCSR